MIGHEFLELPEQEFNNLFLFASAEFVNIAHLTRDYSQPHHDQCPVEILPLTQLSSQVFRETLEEAPTRCSVNAIKKGYIFAISTIQPI